MKKIFTILCLMALTVGAQAEDGSIVVTANNAIWNSNDGTYTTNKVWTSNATEKPVVTITGASEKNSQAWNTGNGVLMCNQSDGLLTLTISIAGDYRITGFSFTGGCAWNTKAVKFSSNGQEVQGMSGVQMNVTGLNTVSTVITAIAVEQGDRAKITDFEIFYTKITTCNITYRVVDENGTTLTTKTESVESGTSITSLPASMQHTLFYDYSTENYTAEEGLVATFTATLKDSAPFIFTADATSPVWYGLTLSATPNYVTYTAGGAQNVTLPTTNADDETTHWAFIGNPYAGFTIVNEAAGTSLVLGSAATTGSANNGGNVYATLAAAGSQTNELWTVHASTYISGKNGFFLQNTEGHRLNKRNGTANVSYWTGGADAGSTFVATKVPGLAELIPQAETLLIDLTAGANDVQIGYPTASALSTFQQAIADAKTATDEAAGLAALKAAIADVKSPANTIYTPRTDVYYTITSGRGSMVYDSSHSSDVDGNGNEFLWYTTSLDKTNANHQWGFIEKDGVYYMYNVGKRQFAGVTTANPQVEGKNFFANGAWMFSNTPSSVKLDAGIEDLVPTPAVRVQATSAVTGQTYAMSISTSYTGPVITYDAKNDGGIPMTFAVATATQDAAVTTAIEALLEDLQPYRDALQEVIDKANTLTFGTGMGEYTASTDFTNALTTAESQVDPENTSATKESITAARTALETAIAASLNMPTVGKFYRIKTAKAWATEKASNFNNTQPYLIGENHSTQIKSTTRAAFSTTAGEDASSIWYLTTIGESPTQYLVNFSNGRPAVNNSGFLGVGKDAQFLSTHGTSIVFKAATNGEIGAYGIVFAAGTRALYTNVNLYTDAAGADGSGAGYNFELEEVPSLPITMHDGQDGRYYATFSAPVAISSITGATAHKVKVENEKAKYSETGVEGIPASTGVLLINETGDKATLTIGDFTETIDTDLQYIFAAETSHEGLFFGLSTENKLGFFKLMEGAAPSTGGFKAYLNAPAGAKGVELVADNEATGVEAIDGLTPNPSPNGKGSMYNLQGQRVNKAQKGVFIQNGKKVVVR